MAGMSTRAAGSAFVYTCPPVTITHFDVVTSHRRVAYVPAAGAVAVPSHTSTEKNDGWSGVTVAWNVPCARASTATVVAWWIRSLPSNLSPAVVAVGMRSCSSALAYQPDRLAHVANDGSAAPATPGARTAADRATVTPASAARPWIVLRFTNTPSLIIRCSSLPAGP